MIKRQMYQGGTPQSLDMGNLTSYTLTGLVDGAAYVRVAHMPVVTYSDTDSFTYTITDGRGAYATTRAYEA